MGILTTAGHAAILFASTAAFGALAQEGASPAGDLSIAFAALDMPASARPFVIRTQLGTNAGGSVRELVLLGEAEGARQILSLTKLSVLEEQWAYLPGPGIWVEVGVNEDLGPLGPQVESDGDYLAHLIRTFDRVHLYHFHPQHYFASEEAVAIVYDLTTPVDGLAAEERAAIALALPSPTDVASSASVAVMNQELHTDGEVRNFVVSPYGIVEYQPTRVGRQRLASERGHPLATTMRDMTTITAVRRASFNVERTVAARPGLVVSELILTLCQQLSGPDYMMEYVPFDVSWD